MAGDIYVSFGADTADLEAAMAVAKANVSELSSEMRDLAEQFNVTGATADSDLGQQMVTLGGKLNQARGQVVGIKEELKGVGKTEEGEEERLTLFERMKESLEGLTSPLADLQSHFSELIEIIAAAFAVEKVADWAAETTEHFEQVESEAAKLGVSMRQVESLQAVATLAGTDYGELTQQFERLQLSLSKIGDKATPASEALRVLGISAAELRGQSLDRQMETIGEAFSKFEDGPTKAAAAIALLGKAGADMIPFLDKGREGIEELRGVAERTGVLLSDEMSEALAKSREDISELGLAWQGLSQKAYAALNPAIDSIVVALSHMLEKISQADISSFALQMVDLGGSIRVGAVTAFETLNASLQDFSAWSERVQLIVDQLSAKFANWGEKIGDVTGVLGRLFAVAGDSGPGDDDFSTRPRERAKGASSGPYGGLYAPDQLQTMFSRNVPEIAGENALKAGLAISQATSDAKTWSEKMRETMAAPHDAAAPAEGARKPAVPQMNLGGGGAASSTTDDTAQIVRQTYETEVQKAKESVSEIEENLKRELEFHQITMKEWLTQSVQALDQEQDAIQDAADKALASASLTTAEKMRLARQEDVEISAIAKKLAQDQDAAAKDTLKSWQSAFNQINSAFDAQIDGLLRGTTSWGQAFRNVLASLVEDLTKFFVNWGLKEVEQNIESVALSQTRVAAHVAGNATIAASDAGAAASGGLAWAASALRQIAASAAEAFAGVFGWLAPILGPAAAGPAAAAQASVLAVGASVASADIGMWSVPSDMLTMVHHNELIMPAAESKAFRSMLSGEASGEGQGGGRNVSISPQTHFHVNAVDGAGVAQFFRNNQRAMMRSVNAAVRDGAHLGLRRLAT